MVIELKKGKEWINRMIRKIFDGSFVYSITRYVYLKKGEKSFTTTRDQNFVKNRKLKMIRKRKWVKITDRWRHWKENWTRVFEKSKKLGWFISSGNEENTRGCCSCLWLMVRALYKSWAPEEPRKSDIQLIAPEEPETVISS